MNEYTLHKIKENIFLKINDKRVIGTKFLYTDLSESNLDNLDISDLELYYCNIEQSSFNYTIQIANTLSCSNFKLCDFSYANFIGNIFDCLNLNEIVTFCFSDSGSNFYSCNFSNSKFQNSFLCGTEFCSSKLNSVVFSNCNFNYTFFSNSNLSDSVFKDSYLYDVDFSDCNLNNVQFINCTLVKCKFKNTDICKTKFSEIRIFRTDYELHKLLCDKCEYIYFLHLQLEKQRIVDINFEAKPKKIIYKKDSLKNDDYLSKDLLFNIMFSTILDVNDLKYKTSISFDNPLVLLDLHLYNTELPIFLFRHFKNSFCFRSNDVDEYGNVTCQIIVNFTIDKNGNIEKLNLNFIREKILIYF